MFDCKQQRSHDWLDLTWLTDWLTWLPTAPNSPKSWLACGWCTPSSQCVSFFAPIMDFHCVADLSDWPLRMAPKNNTMFCMEIIKITINYFTVSILSVWVDIRTLKTLSYFRNRIYCFVNVYTSQKPSQSSQSSHLTDWWLGPKVKSWTTLDCNGNCQTVKDCQKLGDPRTSW